MPRYRICYSKHGPARYISHLDLVRALERALRRAGLPVAYSEGFNPHPRLSFAAPLPVGSEGLAELVDVETTAPVARRELAGRLNAALPRGLSVREVTEVPENAPSLMAALDSAGYIVHVDAGDLPACPPADAVRSFLALDHIEVTRRGKDGQEKVRDIRPGILDLKMLSVDGDLILELRLKTGSAMNVRPEEAVEAFLRHAGLAVDRADLRITRTGLFAGDSVLSKQPG
ncbi:DUF2344 domain-containing protein [Desulfallas sp. Bu1-1]|uniref:TIGR03936 family radical SAM-associated protein n=1 Tax=Desulfallas sp. Bu1-1 TaxID=2787620 RepID=UPI00189FDDE8|nr:TIGR03936 family radical SAM-associated protein [Desulfallas sp. Bu1-1]MBF7083706.1 DUF2344 domain-containing protein [Desulfallas sp. Bu1-1]